MTQSDVAQIAPFMILEIDTRICDRFRRIGTQIYVRWTPAESVIAELCDMGTGARYTGIAWRFPPSGGRERNRIGAIWGNRCDRGESVRVQ